MYERFFGLDEAPFRLTPDPRYLFLSPKHREALGHLVFGVREGSGFVSITGEIGAGKTTLLRALLRATEEGVQYAYILNPVLSGVELLQEINQELGLRTEGSRRELLTELNDYLLAQKAEGRRIVVVVDEAQALEGAILEQLRLLSNLETETSKLLQIVLVGQPELRDLLARPELAQLNQRITVRWHLLPLDRAETAAYIAHRLKTAAGGQAKALFSRGAIDRIFQFSKGVPRLINIACHRALLVAYAAESPTVTPKLARRAIGELRMHQPQAALSPRKLWLSAAAAAAFAAAITSAALTLLDWPRPVRRSEPDAAAVALLPTATAPPDALALPAASPAAPQAAAAPGASPAAPEPARELQAAAVVPEPPAATAGVGAETADAAEAADREAASDEDPREAADRMQLTAERSSFAEALRQASPGASAYEATQALLRGWQAKGLTAAEAANAQLDLGRIARARGLQYRSLYGNLNLLRLLDLPAILEVVPPDGSSARFVAVRELDEERARVIVGSAEVELDPIVLSETWFGKAHLFWRDFDNIGGSLGPGMSGSGVTRLQALLAEAGVYNGPRTAFFGTETEAAVSRFQRSNRLFADGKPGPLTLIALYRRDADRQMPTIARRSATAAATP